MKYINVLTKNTNLKEDIVATAITNNIIMDITQKLIR
tara:strand:- start:9768 stop:9878 length:111 start_codon:yes stop_codon:yes gene_type:complete